MHRLIPAGAVTARRASAALLATTLVAALVAPVTTLAAAPVAGMDTIAVDEDSGTWSGNLLANDTDADGGALYVSTIGHPAAGVGVLDLVNPMTGDVTFTPAAQYHGGPVDLAYSVSDGTTAIAGTIRITVSSVNDAPVVTAQSVVVAHDTASAITLSGSDVDDEALVYAVADAPAHGDLTGLAPDLTYTPDPGYAGPDAFTFTANDGDVDSAPATVSITVSGETVPPVPTAPTVAFGTGRVNETAPLMVTWSATDAGVGVADYEVEVKVGDAAWAPFATGPATSTQAAFAFGTPLQWRVRATDANDNTSDWAVSAVRTLEAFQGAAPVTATGSWTSVASKGSSGVGYRYTTTMGRKVKLTFTGVGVLYVAPRVANGGRALVTVAGNTTGVSLRSASTRLGEIVVARQWSSSASRTIKVVNDRAGRRTTFDAFIVLH